jgi:hypothetical protein
MTNFKMNKHIQTVRRSDRFPSLRIIGTITETLIISSETVRMRFVRIDYVLKAVHLILNSVRRDFRRIQVNIVSSYCQD